LGDILFAGPTGAQAALLVHIVARSNLRTLGAHSRDLDVCKLALERREFVIVLAHRRKGLGARVEHDARAAHDRKTPERYERGAPRSALAQSGREQRE
jgi:hypothetical protein